MPNRRKTKGERELIADIKKATLILCNKYRNGYNCDECPLSKYVRQCNWSCMLAYVYYITNKKSAEE